MSLKEKELYRVTVIEEKDLTEAELEGNDYPVVYLEEDVVLVVAELRKELWDICVKPKHYDCDKCPFMNKDKEICILFTRLDEKFGCEKPMKVCSQSSEEKGKE